MTTSIPTATHCRWPPEVISHAVWLLCRLRLSGREVFAGGVTPQWDQHLQAQASEPLDPGALGQRAAQTRGEVFIPVPHAAQFGVRAAAKEGRKHYPNNLAQQLLLAS